MKRFIQALLFTLLLAYPLFAGAAPYLTCDPYTALESVDQFVVVMDGGGQQTVAAQVMADGKTRLWFDLGTVSVGTHNMTIKAKNSVWGQESTAAPFVFSKPASCAAPGGLVITK